MYILAKMLLLNYIPEKLERNMLFKSESGEVFTFLYTTMSLERVIEVHGYPVAPYIVPISANPDEYVQPLALPEQIGWFDEGPHADELRDITKDDINHIMLNDDGYIQIEVVTDIAPNGVEIIKPEIYLDKVTISFVMDDDNDDYPDDEEDWDDMDDLTDDDPL